MKRFILLVGIAFPHESDTPGLCKFCQPRAGNFTKPRAQDGADETDKPADQKDGQDDDDLVLGD